MRIACCALLLFSAAGCIGAEAPSRAPNELALRVLDWQGEESAPSEMARRPRLVLEAAGGIDPSMDAVALLAGDPDDALLDDLEDAPLRVEHASRAVACDMVARPDALELVPLAPLARDSAYTLVLGAWASSLSGTRLSRDASPQAFALRTASGPDAGAAVLGAWPADGTHAVGIDLAEAVAFFDGEVIGADSGVWLEGPDGLAVPASVRSEPCDVSLAGERATHCVTLVPLGALAPSASHALRIGAQTRDAHGAPVGAWNSRWATDAGVDRTSPVATSIPCDVDAHLSAWGCTLVDDARIELRVRASEPVRLEVSREDATEHVVAPGGDADARLVDLAPEHEASITVILRDATGNASAYTETIATEPALATLSIVEVRADPLGPEPDQEFVELENYGNAPIPLLGFSLSDRGDKYGEPIETAALAHPGERILFVTDAFDRTSSLDVPPPPGAVLVRVGETLAEDGLANAGEQLYLRDPWGRRVSAAPATPGPRPGVCSVRITREMRDGRDGSFAHDPDDGCSPGR